ncbi:MAG: hypothetical protein JRF53_19105 [Deltaproteobacteria bacterium]|nr:hypothetical protein [Deltaproteobacteria bacterium]
MTKRDLETYMKEHVGMELYEFIKYKVEVESLHDYEIARILNVEAAFIGRLRNNFGIKRANGFSRRFERTYGLGAVETFKKMIENPDNSLSDVARHFGFSRQNAWHVYKKIYDRPYTEAYKRKRLKKRQES